MTTPIGQTTQTAAPPPTAPRNQATSSLDSEAFLKLLIAQVKYQDPTNPADPGQFLAQTAQLTQVDVLNKLVASQQSTLAATLNSQAAHLVGSTVDYVGADGVRTRGTVESASFGASPSVRIGSADIPLADVLGTAAD